MHTNVQICRLYISTPKNRIFNNILFQKQNAEEKKNTNIKSHTHMHRAKERK